jgi:REP element-mobilizing transposase RayT
MSTTLTNLLYHIVFSTKNRLPRIDLEVRDRLYEYVGGIARGHGGILLAIGGMPDHVHLLVKGKADTSVSDMTRLIKANSSKWMNETFHPGEHFEWQAGYGAFSVSESKVNAVRRYIQAQESHQAKVSFAEELVTLLQRHGIEYDPRYLLG